MITPHISRDVATISEEESVCAAAARLRDDAVGCLVVLDGDGEVSGMLTDRDLALRVVAADRDPKHVRVADAMTSPVVFTDEDADLDDVIALMRARGIRRIPICDDGEPVGLVALDDALQTLAREVSDLGREASAKVRKARRRAKVERVRHDAEDLLEELHRRLALGNWYAREAFLDRLDDLRDRLHLSPDDD
ncbi:MAG: CBS domain-containing protein [Planctomycetota bacterium]|jgi:CBS domain-containing protein|nr:CBS domain-containing protein [Planctomycetota bacterium]MDP6761919.1 CBS domain-containing protein [Planctomycetota bacterium]MDP6990355.1 CBS domain-containing protein [Planctomycetota bacterium]